jgi:hypothetical protein
VPVDARLPQGIVRAVRGVVEVFSAILEALLKPVGAHGSRTVRDHSFPIRPPGLLLVCILGQLEVCILFGCCFCARVNVVKRLHTVVSPAASSVQYAGYAARLVHSLRLNPKTVKPKPLTLNPKP